MNIFSKTFLITFLALSALTACRPGPEVEPEPLPQRSQATWISLPTAEEAAASPDMPEMKSVLYDFGVAPDGTIWTGAQTIRDGQQAVGIWYFKDSVWTYFIEYEEAFPDAYEEALATRFLFDSEGNMWFGLKTRVVKWDGKEFEEFPFPYTLKNNWLNVLEIEDDGSVWVGGEQYVGRLSNGFWTAWTLLDAEQAWHYDAVVREGEAWVGTDAGLYILSDVSNRKITEVEIEESPDNTIVVPLVLVPGIVEDTDGTIYVSTTDGILTWKEDNWEVLSPGDNLPSPSPTWTWGVSADEKGNIYIGTAIGLFRIDEDQWTFLGPADELSAREEFTYGLSDVRFDAESKQYILLDNKFYQVIENQ